MIPPHAHPAAATCRPPSDVPAVAEPVAATLAPVTTTTLPPIPPPVSLNVVAMAAGALDALPVAGAVGDGTGVVYART